MRPTTTARRTRAVALVAALLVIPIAAGCGVEARDGGAAGPDVPVLGGSTTTTAPLPPCGDEPDTGGAVGGDDKAPTCSPDPEPGPDETTTTSDGPDETTTTTEPDDAGADEQAYIDSLSEELRTDDTFGDLGSDRAECIAEDWVATLDPQQLQDAGISPEDLQTGSIDDALTELIDEDIAAELIGALGGCDVDVDQILADELRAGGDVPADKVDCLIDALPEGYVENLLAISLDGGRDALDADPDLQEPLLDAAAQCQ